MFSPLCPLLCIVSINDNDDDDDDDDDDVNYVVRQTSGANLTRRN